MEKDGDLVGEFVEGWFARRHLDDGASNTPYIRLSSVSWLSNDLHYDKYKKKKKTFMDEHEIEVPREPSSKEFPSVTGNRR